MKPDLEQLKKLNKGEKIVPWESAMWSNYLGSLKGAHHRQVSVFGGLWQETFALVLDGLEVNNERI